MITTKVILIVIAMNSITGKTHYFAQEYSSISSCQEAKKNVKTRMYKTWRYCDEE